MPVFSLLFVGSTKKHEIGSLFCAACDPHAGIHTGCGVTHSEKVPHQTGDIEEFEVVTVCDGCGQPQ
jgi:hypothetical protein